MKIHNLGLPRIGEKRELKFALEKFWSGKINADELEKCAKSIRLNNIKRQIDAGLDLITVGDFSLYDQVLDHTIMFNNIPERFNHLKNHDLYFSIARGYADSTASKMQKWFNTNYHYIVPEFSEDREFNLNCDKLMKEIKEVLELGIDIEKIKPVVIGPLSYLWLGGDHNLCCLEKISRVYKKLFTQLEELGIQWIQVDEPILVLDKLSKNYSESFISFYNNWESSLKIIMTTYFESVEDNLEIIKNIPIDILHVDVTDTYSETLKGFELIAENISNDTVLSLGIISGRNIWVSDLEKIRSYMKECKYSNKVEWIAPSSSLIHLPVTTTNEKQLPDGWKSFLSFAHQRVNELSIIRDFIEEEGDTKVIEVNRRALNLLKSLREDRVDEKLYNRDYHRVTNYISRKKIQQSNLKLKSYPTTTIGSFPQTDELRKIRYRFKKQLINLDEYERFIKNEINKCIKIQEELGLDLLVHGEPERNDMVEYFAELLDGYLITELGWVQSYGSRCVKPSIIYKDIKRIKPMTVDWISYASSLTDKPVKGMLTGPITMFKWAFNRLDIPYVKVTEQLADVINQEVKDLIDAGIKVIQIDEAALKEALPIKNKLNRQYQLDAARVFRLCSRDIPDNIQIHTHMCYSDFNDIVCCLKKMDFDVITIETTRSKMKILRQLKENHITGDIGPGIYDIHSPNIPGSDHMHKLFSIALREIESDRLWINPDCGLKTRKWDEVIPSLGNMVRVAKSLRS